MPDNNIAGSIFGAQPSKLAATPWLVTVQLQFKIDAISKQGAELSIMKGLSIGVLLSPSQVSYGCEAQPLTQQLLESMGIDLGRKS